jgi:hypothetical protein
MFHRSNFKEWIDRYKYAELAATSSALASSQFIRIYDGVTTAYFITVAEYLAFYGVILFTTYRKLVQTNQSIHKRTSWKEVFLLMRNLVLEFGYPALLDFFVIRPFCMYWMLVLTGNYFLGIVFGKITADSIFYGFTILNYEWIKKK